MPVESPPAQIVTDEPDGRGGCTCPEPLDRGPGTCARCVWRRGRIEAFEAPHPHIGPNMPATADAP